MLCLGDKITKDVQLANQPPVTFAINDRKRRPDIVWTGLFIRFYCVLKVRVMEFKIMYVLPLRMEHILPQSWERERMHLHTNLAGIKPGKGVGMKQDLIQNCISEQLIII